MKSLFVGLVFKGRVLFVYYLHPQGMMMTYSASVSLMNNPRSHGLTFSRTWSIKHKIHIVLWVIESLSMPNFLRYTTPLFFCTKLHFSPNERLWPSPISGSFGMPEMDERPTTCVALFFSGPRHCRGRKAFCIHARLHSHSTHFTNTTQHPIQQNALFSSPHGVQTTMCEDGLLPVGLSHRGYRAEAVLSEIFFI